MDVTLHKRCAKFVYVIPEGLRELMSDISREVIRSQPEHIYTTIADYLDALMITRENARVAARLVDSIIRIGSMTVELLEQTGMSREEANRMAVIIQEAFKKYMAVKSGPLQYSNIQEEAEEEQEIIENIIQAYGDLDDQVTAAAVIIQRAFREFKDRHAREKQLLSGMIDWRVAARSAIYLYRKTGVTNEEANRAATMIKAAYKGYYTRRIMKRLLDEGRQIYDEKVGEILEVEMEGECTLAELPGWKMYHSQAGEVTPCDIMSLSDIKEETSPSIRATESVLCAVLRAAVPDDDESVTVGDEPVGIQPETPPPTEAMEGASVTVTEGSATEKQKTSEADSTAADLTGDIATESEDRTINEETPQTKQVTADISEGSTTPHTEPTTEVTTEPTTDVETDAASSERT